MPLALRRAQDDGRLTRGTRVAMAGFGAGLTWGGAFLDWRGWRHLPDALDRGGDATGASA
jgi:hypothetical protein